jgi:SAM-dependent methyltransferase
MRSSAALYDALAPDYEEHFRAPHRRAYDDLAWEIASAAVGAGPSTIVDVGCGIGRWASRLVQIGHRVIGIEPAPEMARRAAARLAGTDFVLVQAGVLEADPRPALPPSGADAVLAMGSLQYAADVPAALTRCASWLRPGGLLCALLDSRQALVLELLAAGRTDEALLRLTGRRGEWRIGTLTAELHLLDAAELADAVRAAGLVVERLTGLLVGASAYGRAGLAQRLTDDYPSALAEERRLAELPELADLGKQLLVVARLPAP